MKKIKFILILISLILAAFLISCGGGGSGTSNNETNYYYGTAKLGNLANAKVEIYEVENNGSLKLKWIEITSNGNSLNDIGKFNLHSNELKQDVFYVYKVSGGHDWDADDDGVMDNNYTINKGIIRAIAKGEDIIEAGNDFKVTMISEIVYEKVAKTLKYNFNQSTFEKILNEKIAKVIKDIDSNGIIDNKDLIIFDPVVHKNFLTEFYKIKKNEIIEKIHNNEQPLNSISHQLSIYKTLGKAINVTISEDGKKAYIINDNDELEVVDISDPLHPRFIDRTYDGTGDNFKDIVIKNGISYIANGSEGFLIADISDPSNIITYSRLNINGITKRVIYSEKNPFYNRPMAYLANSSKGFLMVEIDDFLSIDSSYNVAYINDLAISSDESTALIVTDYDGGSTLKGFYILDISNVGQIIKKSIYDTQANAYDVTISNDNKTAYIFGDCGLIALDINNTSNPKLLDTYSFRGKSIALSKNNKKIFAVDNKLAVFDVSNPKQIQKLSELNLSDTAYKIVLSSDESKAYVAVGNSGLEILDINDTTFYNYVISSYDASVYEILISKDKTKAFVLSDKGFLILDISSVNDIKLLGSYNIYGYNIILSNDESKAFIVNNDGLAILDISDPKNPNVLGGYNASDPVMDVVLSKNENTAFILSGENIISIDISNPSHPNFIFKYYLNSYGEGIDISKDGKTAFIAAGNDGLMELNVTDPSNIRLINTYRTNTKAYDVLTMNDSIIYIICKDEIEVVDISDLNNPQYITSIISGDIKKSDVNSKIYIAYNNSIYAYDISNVSYPKKLKTYKPFVNCYHIGIVNENKEIFLCDLNMVDFTLYK
ncbi:LVIVD repeat-containing protein [Nautilia lithotrophica]